ncbi:hypothetical protein [Nonomuraea sp. NPDC049158]|uniref:hypothetical protein n=1 Tax=Nonomuraea sp. NPDC049158 TaxID=3155649 RepID=UPI0033D495A3
MLVIAPPLASPARTRRTFGLGVVAGAAVTAVHNTKYRDSYEADQAKGRLVCVFGQSTIGLVKVTKVSDGDSDYITMDLTVRQR